ncbi:hypothetical protein L1987_85808 [Smallanthus sonchifolius]|uniref:Uncharacterized protein n=1 Tax=Smallanthus sonchifolius TaxID=185202 RepID=A0ACB8XYC6_9ASTR|nr:hypothetical protein L1987_85808 [Smallanthus sonchifolius]
MELRHHLKNGTVVFVRRPLSAAFFTPQPDTTALFAPQPETTFCRLVRSTVHGAPQSLFAVVSVGRPLSAALFAPQPDTTDSSPVTALFCRTGGDPASCLRQRGGPNNTYITLTPIESIYDLYELVLFQVEGRTVSAIGAGLLVLVGIHDLDTDSDADYICRKVLNMRLFPNENTGKTWDQNVTIILYSFSTSQYQYPFLCFGFSAPIFLYFFEFKF